LILNSRVANLAYLKPDFEILAFLTHFAFFENQNKPNEIWWLFFHSEKLGSGKTLSEPHIHYKSLLTRVYGHARCTEYCKDFTVGLTVFIVCNKKQMYDSVTTGK